MIQKYYNERKFSGAEIKMLKKALAAVLPKNIIVEVLSQKNASCSAVHFTFDYYSQKMEGAFHIYRDDHRVISDHVPFIIKNIVNAVYTNGISEGQKQAKEKLLGKIDEMLFS